MMDLPCLLPVETPSTGSSGSADPLYDNYYAHMGRERRLCPAVTGAPAAPRHSSPPPALSPAAAEVPRPAGGRGSGARPEQSYRSWGGGLARRAWEGGRATGEGAGERLRQNPSPATSEEHRSTLSVYDNLRDSLTPDHLPEEAVPMETALLEPPLAADGQEAELGSGAFVLLLYPHRVAGPPCSSLTSLPGQLPPAAAVDLHPEELSSQGARVPPPLPLADPSASALRSLLTGIQQQIVRQREEYEARILSLEQRNDELQKQVSGMRANLVQQRSWYHTVQAKILESERARDAAELRNAGLQREMEQFFDSFGELNNEAKKTERIVKSF